MASLNFPSYIFRYKKEAQHTLIFDPIRKKFVILSPEEWVRQHSIQWLCAHKNYPISLLQVEKQFSVHKLSKRFDIVAYTPEGDIFLLVECKAPSTEIDQAVFDQLARYNLALKAKYLMVTNGIVHYFCKIDYVTKKYFVLDSIPNYSLAHV